MNELGIVRYNLPTHFNTILDATNANALATATYAAPYNEVLNIWVVNSIDGNCSGTRGYSPLPLAPLAGLYSGITLDGVVIQARVFGDNTPTANNFPLVPNYPSSGCNSTLTRDRGKVLVHEVGHYLHLWHTFQNNLSSNNSCVGSGPFNATNTSNACNWDGDFCCDTDPVQPPSNTFVFGSPVPATCSNGPDDVNNFMYYADDLSWNTFSTDQYNRMLSFLLQFRSNLYTVPNLNKWGLIGSGTSSCIQPQLFAEFDILDPPCLNTIINFQPTVANPNNTALSTGWSWVVTPSTGVTITGGNTATPTMNFNILGNYTITSTAQDASSNTQTSSQSITITNCSLNPNYINSSNWFYGFFLGLDFSSGSPTFNADALNNQTVFSTEGTFTYSDDFGNLVFYTDGIDIWDASHNQLNATSPFMPSNPQATFPNWSSPSPRNVTSVPGIVAVPFPGRPDVFIVIRTNTGGSAPNNIRYVILDMSTVTPSVSLPISLSTTPTNIAINGEGLCIVPHCNGQDYWLVGHRTHFLPGNQAEGYFISYLISPYGLIDNPVVSQHFGAYKLNGVAESFKINSTNDRLAYAPTNQWWSGTTPMDVVIYDFDNSTGVVSNEVIIDVPSSFHTVGTSFASNLNPDLLYFYNASPAGEIWQVDLSSANALTQIPTPSGFNTRYMQLGPDDNIYLGRRTNTNTIHRISNPHIQNSAVYTNNVLSYPSGPGGADGVISMPNHIDGLMPPYTPLSFSINYISCTNIELSVPQCWGGYEYHIDWGDGNSTNSINFPTNLPHTYSSTAGYTITLTLLEPGTIDPLFPQNPVTLPTSPIQSTQTINIYANPATIMGNTSACANTSLPIQYAAAPVISGATYNWTITPSTAGNIINSSNHLCDIQWTATGAATVNVTITQGGCVLNGSYPVVVQPSPIMSISASGNLCAPPVTLSALPTTGITNYIWNGPVSGTGPTLNASLSGTYTLTGISTNGCQGSASISVGAPNVSITQVGCGLVTSPMGFPAANYVWNGPGTVNVTGNPFTPTLGGTYTVTVTDGNGCTGTSSFNFTPPNIGTQANPLNAIVCLGDPLILNGTNTATATNPTTYTWSGPMNISNGTAFFPTANGLYTVTGTDANGCTATSTIAVVVNPLPVVNAWIGTITSQNTIDICLGDNAQLSSTLGFPFYGWTPVAGLTNFNSSNPTASPANSTIYMVTVLDANNCSNTATVTVNVNPNPSLTASQIGCDLLATPTGGTPPYTNYQWSGPSSGTGNPYTPGPNNGLYTVTVTDANSCTASTTVNFANTIACCMPSLLPTNQILNNPNTQDVYNLYNNLFSTALVPGQVMSNNFTFGVDGILTVDQDMTLLACSLYMAPDAEIIVNSGRTFEDTDNSIIQAACGEMWRGIDVQSGQVKLGGTTVKHMQYGIRVLGNNRIEANGAKLEDNYVSIDLDGLPSANTSFVEGCVFRTLAANLLSPYQNLTRGERGVLIKNCRNFTLGGSAFTNQKNTFDNLMNGVTIIQDDASIPSPNQITTSRNIFKNIGANHTLWGYGVGLPIYETARSCAIYAKNSTANYMELMHRGHKNVNATIKDFENCEKAVLLNHMSGVVLDNWMQNVDGGILAYRTDGKDLHLIYNTIENTYLGILTSGNLTIGDISTNTIKINQPPHITTSPTLPYISYTCRGIENAYFSNQVNTWLDVRHHTISTAADERVIGVNLYNRGQGGGSLIESNVVSFDATSPNNSSGLTLPHLIGFKATKTWGNLYKGNKVKAVNSGSMLSDSKTSGFILHRSPKNTFECNIMDYLQYGMYVLGDNNTGDYRAVRNNRFAASRAGLMYFHLANEATVGDIGLHQTIAPFTQYNANNKFTKLLSTPDKSLRVTVNCTNPASDQLATPQSNPEIIQTESNVVPSTQTLCKLDINLASSFNSTFDCGVSNAPGSKPNPDGVHDVDYAEDVAQDNVNYTEYPEGGEYMDERDLYYMLDHDNGVRATRPILNSFYLANQQEPMAYLYEVNELIAQLSDSTLDRTSVTYDNILASAKSLNSQIITQEPFEINERWVNTLYLDMLTPDWSGFTQTEVDNILQLAADCPYLGGFGVFKARTLATAYAPLRHYDDLWICNNMGVYKNGNTRFMDELKAVEDRRSINTLVKDGQFKLYPNPNNGLLHIDYKGDLEIKNAEFVMYDILGKVVVTKSIDIGHTSITLPPLTNGIYTYTISDKNETLQRGKIQLDR
jgi:hypothetical protein